jgi:hypothetical protein
MSHPCPTPQTILITLLLSSRGSFCAMDYYENTVTFIHRKNEARHRKKNAFSKSNQTSAVLYNIAAAVLGPSTTAPLLAGSQPAVTPACATLTHLRLPHGGALAIRNGAILNSSVSDSTSCVLWHGFYSAATRGLHAITSCTQSVCMAWPFSNMQPLANGAQRQFSAVTQAASTRRGQTAAGPEMSNEAIFF